MTDNVNHPSHYAEGWSNGAEVIDITENLSFNRGNAVKYIARAGVKDPETELEDLQKAQWYLNRELERLQTWVGDYDFFIDHMSAPIVPRVWESLTDVPEGVEVYGRGEGPGAYPWVGEGPGGDTTYDKHGPFTEVVEELDV